MSTRRVQSSAIKPRTLGAGIAPWVRNPSWRALTAVGDSEQKFSGIVAVFPQGSYLALSAAGNYTVDWGDGASENVNTGVTANKLYDFNDADLANTNGPVTLTDAGDLVERTAHGYSNGMEVRFYNIVSTTGLTTAQVYYVINATANNFQVAATVGGSAVALSTNGSATLLPYKQAIVTVTPQAGQNLTTITLNLKNTTSGLQAYETGWLDIEVGSPNFTSITLAGGSVRFSMCERAAVRSIGSVTNLSSLFSSYYKLQAVVLGNTAAATNMSSMFSGCQSLSTVPLFNTAAVTNMSSMFNNCYSLAVVPLFNTVAVTNMSSMFRHCRSLAAIPLFNTVAVTSMESMLRDCYSLTTVPLFNTVAVTNMSTMFQDSRSLATVPLFNTAAVTNMSTMFFGCDSLATVPLFNTAAVTNISLMFTNCVSLVTVPLFNTAAVTNMSLMFSGCSSLAAVPLFNTAAVTNMSSMFSGCLPLVTVPLFNTAAVTNIQSMFNNCLTLSSVPALNVSAVSSSGNFGSMFSGCNSLSRIQAANFNYTFSVASCKLGATELNEIYTNLPVAVGQTITVSNNVGTTGDDPTIATLKGWTVTG
jgi:surface protein